MSFSDDGPPQRAQHTTAERPRRSHPARSPRMLAILLLDFTMDAQRFLLEGRSEQAGTDLEGRFTAPELRRGIYSVRARGTKLRAEIEVTRDGQDLGRIRLEVR